MEEARDALWSTEYMALHGFCFAFFGKSEELFSFFFGSPYFIIDSKEYLLRTRSVHRRIAYWQPLRALQRMGYNRNTGRYLICH